MSALSFETNPNPNRAVKAAAVNTNANAALKETVVRMKPQVVKSIAAKEWKDPPKRKDKYGLNR